MPGASRLLPVFPFASFLPPLLFETAVTVNHNHPSYLELTYAIIISSFEQQGAPKSTNEVKEVSHESPPVV